jgi:hypothetical protein
MPNNRGYTTSALVQRQLRRVLTGDELADADRKIAAVEMFLDSWSGQIYSATGEITDEMAEPVARENWARTPVTMANYQTLAPYLNRTSQLGLVQLQSTPVGEIIAVRSKPNGNDEDNVGFIPADPMFPGSVAKGLLNVPGYFAHPYVFITYKSLAGVPAIFSEITTQIVAYMMPFGATDLNAGTTSFRPSGPLNSFSLGGDLSMSFGNRPGASFGSILAGIPPEVWPLLMSIKRFSIG